jgi:hypothetical protein
VAVLAKMLSSQCSCHKLDDATREGFHCRSLEHSGIRTEVLEAAATDLSTDLPQRKVHISWKTKDLTCRTQDFMKPYFRI